MVRQRQPSSYNRQRRCDNLHATVTNLQDASMCLAGCTVLGTVMNVCYNHHHGHQRPKQKATATVGSSTVCSATEKLLARQQDCVPGWNISRVGRVLVRAVQVIRRHFSTRSAVPFHDGSHMRHKILMYQYIVT